MPRASPRSNDQALLELVRHKGILRARDLQTQGLSRVALRRLAAEGQLLSLDQGLYVLPESDFTEHHSLLEVACRVPHATICLLSALSFHQIGTQLPHQVWLCIEGHARTPRLDGERLQVVRQSGAAWTEGVEVHPLSLGGAIIPVRMTTPAKTIADCFKFRSRVGLDIALEALREGLRERKATFDEIGRMAQINRVANVMRPYLEVMAFR